MIEVAEAARRLQPPPPPVLAELRRLSVHSPLAPEPFLVRGAMAAREGRFRQAEKLFVEARRRAPRSLAARYLLADLYLRANKVEAALDQLAVLVRLDPSFYGVLAPALAQYAHTPGAAPHLRKLVRDNPRIGSVLLSELASDADSAGLVLSLAPARQSKDAPEPWQQKLVSTLATAGDYDKAYRLAQQFAGAGGREQGGFADTVSFAPFRWKLAHSAAGDAQRSGSRLNVFFSGEDTVTLASKTTVLPAGTYKATAGFQGAVPEAVRWIASCLPGKEGLTELPSHGKSVAVVRITPGCRAQQWQLVGTAETFPTASSFSVTSFDIAPVSKR